MRTEDVNNVKDNACYVEQGKDEPTTEPLPKSLNAAQNFC